VRKVFISGVTGQDGAHLAQELLNSGCQVFGGFRRGDDKFWRLDYLGIFERVELIEFQLSEPQSFFAILQENQFDEIYHLAGESFVADSFGHPILTLELNTNAVCNLLEATRLTSPHSRIFIASSSEIYGNGHGSTMLTEESVANPGNPYGISKLAADYFVKMYREVYGLFVCSGVMFNHEGPLRGRQFVTRKISHNLARLKMQGGPPLKLGNLNASKDWGAAADYVRAMVLMLRSDEPNDYVIASGELNSVRDLLTLSSNAAGFRPIFEGEGLDETCRDESSGLVLAQVDERYFRLTETYPIAGDPSKIANDLGWRRNQNLRQIVDSMVEADVNRWKAGVSNV